MNAPLIDRVRERLAAVVRAAAAERGRCRDPGRVRRVLGDAEVLTSLRELHTELVGAGVLEAAVVCTRHHRRCPRPLRRGVGGRRQWFATNLGAVR